MAVRVVYVNDYDTTGDGFHHFLDPEDGEEYVYTNFEPYEAHRLFPCFDQPDIKGRYTVAVSQPAAWACVANAPIASVTDLPDGRRRHQFAQSELFSAYLMALVCGPFVARHHNHNGLALGLYSRRSLERELDEHAEEIFEITTQGMDFFSSLFDQPYPFAKYDQIFVPEYNSGAMENVGAVTYNEAYLFRDPPTENERLDRGEVLLHELAHMWFGNLVTMRWWDDLWLNESFATYISYLALTSATRFTNAWKVFNTDIKRWAYQQDQLPTTHPIAGSADDTEIAFLNFDGITYGKGASVLKQLVKTVGLDKFRDGLRIYFRRYAWSNATLRDFMSCIEEASGPVAGRLVAPLAGDTVGQHAVRRLAGRWRSADRDEHAPGGIRGVPHAAPSRLPRSALATTAPAISPSSRGCRPITGVECRRGRAGGTATPDFVFPNYDDHAYAKVALDPVTLEYVGSSLDHIDDGCCASWCGCRSGRWCATPSCARPSSWPSAAIGYLTRPTSTLSTPAVERATMTLWRFVPDSQRAAEAAQMFQSAVSNLKSARTADARIIWARAAIAWAESAADIEHLIGLVDGKEARCRVHV
jgi:aminopeptidase N